MKKILFALLCSLILVGSANADTYVVKSGDTLYKIGKSFGVSYETIAEDNGITNPNLILVGQRLQVEKKLGYTPVTDYSSRTTQYISATATTIPVASTKDSAGNQIVLSNISTSGTVKVYLNIEPGGTNVEPVICTGLTTTSWTNCSRGIAFQGSSEVASSSLAKPHNAGSKIIITNIGQFYNQYVSVDGNQQVNDLKTFSSGQIGFTGTRKIVDNGTNLGWTDNGVDTYTFAAGGSGLAASSTKGIGVTDSKIYVNASSTTGMSFDANGALYQKINSSSGVEYASGSSGIGINTSTLVSLIATSTPTAGKIVMTGATDKLDSWVTNRNQITLTAGENITAGNAVILGNGIAYTTITQSTLNAQDSIGGVNWKSQTFITRPTSKFVTGGTLIMSGGGGGDATVTVSLRATSGGLPTGADLGSGTFTLPSAYSAQTKTFTFSSPIAVTGGTTYALVVRSGTGANGWHYNNSSVYEDGNWAHSTDSGSSWTADATYDGAFSVQEISSVAGQLFKTDPRIANDLSTNFIGFATANITSGDSGIVDISGVNSNQAGLSVGYTYYLSNTPGAIATSEGTISRKIGLSVSATQILIKHDNP